MRRRRAIANALTPVGSFIPSSLGDPPSGNNDPIRMFEVSVAEAERLVRAARGRSFFVRTCHFAKNKDQSGAASGQMRGREVSSNIKVPKREALKYLKDAYEHCRDTHLVQVSFCSTCLFIGG